MTTDKNIGLVVRSEDEDPVNVMLNNVRKEMQDEKRLRMAVEESKKMNEQMVTPPPPLLCSCATHSRCSACVGDGVCRGLMLVVAGVEPAGEDH